MVWCFNVVQDLYKIAIFRSPLVRVPYFTKHAGVSSPILCVSVSIMKSYLNKDIFASSNLLGVVMWPLTHHWKPFTSLLKVKLDISYHDE